MENPMEVKDAVEEKERKPRANAREGGGNSRNFGQGGRGRGGGWRNKRRQDGGGPRSALKPVSAEALSLESILAREDKPIVFDLSIGRDKLELNDWFKSYAPSKIRRSDGIGWIMVLSELITNEEKKFLFEREENHMALTEEWRKLTLEPDNVINFQTIKDLALKHDCKGGKWICHPSGAQLDEIWQRTVLAMAYGKLADGVIAIKISPINDLDIPGGNSRGGARAKDHVLCVITRDMTNEGQVLQIEKTLRAIPIKSDMQYKPNVFSQLGIYRNNKYKLRPTIYSSSKDATDENHGYKIESVVDKNWTYVVGSEDATNNNMTIDDLKEKLNNIRSALSEVCTEMAKIGVKNVEEFVQDEPKASGDPKIEMKVKDEPKASGDPKIEMKVKDEPKASTQEVGERKEQLDEGKDVKTQPGDVKEAKQEMVPEKPNEDVAGKDGTTPKHELPACENDEKPKADDVPPARKETEV